MNIFQLLSWLFLISFCHALLRKQVRFKDNIEDKIEVSRSQFSTRHAGRLTDFSTLIVRCKLEKMLNVNGTHILNKVKLEMKSNISSNWQLVNVNPTNLFGTYTWNITGLIPCQSYNIKLSLENYMTHYIYPNTIEAATRTELIENYFVPATPQNVNVEYKSKIWTTEL